MPETDPQMQCGPGMRCRRPVHSSRRPEGGLTPLVFGSRTSWTGYGGEIPLAIVTSGQVPDRVLSLSPGSDCAMTLQVISVLGALMVLVAYGLIQAGTWRELDAGYLALNIIGSLLWGIVAIEDRRVGFVLLEFAWAGIAMIGVVRAVRARRAARGL